MSYTHRGAPVARRILSTSLLAALAHLAGCTPSGSADSSQLGAPTPVANTRQAVWVNGDFEDSNVGTVPGGWTLTNYLNKQGGVDGSLLAPPDTFAKLRLGSAGVGTSVTSVIGGAPESQTDPSLGTAGSLRLPKYGQRAVRVNETNYGYNANSLSQTMTASLGDVDPLDDKVHVRFAVAPVLNNPSHPYAQQPYYFVQLRNITRNTTLYTDFNVSAQEGVPWKNVGGTLLYTDWQLVDIAPGNAALAVGDQVQLTVVAANCSQGGATHFSRLYVDAVGSGVPGLYSWATGPQSANSGDPITYTISYKNGGTTTTSGTKVAFVTPPNTTFVASHGGTCVAPAAGSAGTLDCTVGNLAPGGTGSFTATVRVNPGTTGTITNGNYSISAEGVSALIGPKVITTLTTGVQYADVGVTLSDGTAAVGWGEPTRYTAVVTNRGALTAPSVTVGNSMPAQLTQASWTCSASPGSSCGAASGVGAISNTGSLLAGGSLTYSIDATVAAGAGASSIVHSLQATVAGGVVDPDNSNNTAVDTNAVGTLRTLSFAKTGLIEAGSVNTTPSSIACGTSCGNASAKFLEGSQVVLTAAPAAGATFRGWGGACNGNATTCTVTIQSDTAVSATFVGAPSSVLVASGSGQSTTVAHAFAGPLAARVVDAGGTPVPGTTVRFAAPAQGASAALSGASAITDANGIASLAATANTVAGSYESSASVDGLATPARFALGNLAGATTSMQISSAEAQSARVRTAFARALEVTLEDAFGNHVPGATVSFAAPGAGATATLSAAAALSDADGKASVDAHAGTVTGSYVVHATLGNAARSFQLTNTAGDPASVHLVSGAAQSTTVTQPFADPLVVRVEDADGNLVPAASVSFTAPANGASAQLSAAATSSDASGLARITAQANTRAGAFAIVAQVAGGQAPVSFSMQSLAAAAHSITASPRSAQQAAAADLPFLHPLEATVLDQYENPVPNAAVRFVVPESGSTAVLDAPTAHTDADGRVAVGARAGTTTGSFTAEAQLDDVATPARFTLDVLASTPSALQASAGGGQDATVLDAFGKPLTVRLVDRFGNPVAGVALDVQLPADGASASLPPGPYVTDANGEVQLFLTANAVAGSYELIASFDGGAAPVSFTLHNRAGAAATLQASQATRSQSTRVASAFAQLLVVEVRDAHGNPVAGKTVHFTAPDESATAILSAADVVSDSNGRATVQATASEHIGRYTVLARIEGVEEIATFELSNLAAAPAHLTLISGGAQVTRATTPYAQPVVARLSDSHDNPVADVQVNASAPSAGSSVVTSSSQRTGEDGRVSFDLAANAVPGSLQLALFADGIMAPLTIDLTVSSIATRARASIDSTILVVGQTKRLMLTVESDLGAPHGTVAVMDGLRKLADLPVRDGAASMPLLFAEPGRHVLTAVFAAQGPYAESRSASLSLFVQTPHSDDDDDDHGSSSGGSSSGASSSSGTSGDETGNVDGGSGNGGAGSESNGANEDAPFLGLGGGGCSTSPASRPELSSSALALAALLVLRRRRRA